MATTERPTRTRKSPQTPTTLGPADHGKPISDKAFSQADFVDGYKYEIINGRLYVSLEPNLPEHRLESWLRRALERYSENHPEVINFVANKGRVFIPTTTKMTIPEPDIAAYAGFPDDTEIDALNWEDISPVLVCEILVGGTIEKDLGRNVSLYLSVPSIKEYWVLVGSVSPREPTLIQHRRRGKKWVVTTFPYGSTFTTRLLPGFSLELDPRKSPC
ncbi:MAG: Uma2 family endonuclease [Bacteroidales bacterium]|nr:Uma2 family endonuclease [Bacteroidales bacterium]